MLKINRKDYIIDNFLIQTECNNENLTITLSKLNTKEKSKIYKFRLITRYKNQVKELIEDCIFLYNKNNYGIH